jgi:hypothetical protein
MNRRGFLSLLVATPLIPALAKLESVIQAPPPPVVLPPPGGWHLQRYVMSFGDGALVRPGGVVRYSAFMQRIFRPDRIVIPSSGSQFGLLGLSAAGEANLAEEIEAAMFSPLAWGARMQLDTVRPGEEIVICAVNRGAQPAPFHLALMGSCVCDGPPPQIDWKPGDDDDDDDDDDDGGRVGE